MKLLFAIIFMFLTSTALAQQSPQNTTPVPDPTELTAKAIRELRTELTALWDEKFANLTKQIDRNELRIDKIPGDLKDAFEVSEKLTAEKFKGLADQQVQRDNNLALALTAAQKSVSDTNLSTAEAARKAENTFKDQISATQKIIDELGQRVTRIESTSSGAGGAINWIFIAIGALGGLIGVASFFRPPVQVPLPVVQFSETNGRKTR